MRGVRPPRVAAGLLGRLGVLAGDLCKAASDARLPLVGVGPFYHRGYFRQRIDAEGRQEHLEPDLDPADMPLRRAAGTDGAPLEIAVDLPGRAVRMAVWVAQVGRVPLLLLDADLPTNKPEDRRITDELYVAERRTRLTQELLLGMGSAQALGALGVRPAVWHLNEGHSALVLLGRARMLCDADPNSAAPRPLARAGADMVMTLHTPVPAGNERYDPALALELIGPAAAAIDLSPVRLAELGQGPDHALGEAFDLTAFGLRQAALVTAVSRLHGRTATATWRTRSGRMSARSRTGCTCRPGRLSRCARPSPPGGEGTASDRDLWTAHTEQKRQLDFLGGRLTRQAARHGIAPESVGDWPARSIPMP